MLLSLLPDILLAIGVGAAVLPVALLGVRHELGPLGVSRPDRETPPAGGASTPTDRGNCDRLHQRDAF